LKEKKKDKPKSSDKVTAVVW